MYLNTAKKTTSFCIIQSGLKYGLCIIQSGLKSVTWAKPKMFYRPSGLRHVKYLIPGSDSDPTRVPVPCPLKPSTFCLLPTPTVPNTSPPPPPYSGSTSLPSTDLPPGRPPSRPPPCLLPPWRACGGALSATSSCAAAHPRGRPARPPRPARRRRPQPHRRRCPRHPAR